MTIKQHGGVFGRNPSLNDVSVETLSIAGTALSSTATELNILDGVTADATELNYLDGASASTVVASKAVLANSSGNIAFPSGKGIDFSATAGTGTSELFDDYEEGEWTPVIAGGTNPTVAYITQLGYYTKIGNQVTLYGGIKTNTVSGGSGSVKLDGLPFAESPSGGTNSGAVYATINSFAGDHPRIAVVNSGLLFLYFRTSANTGENNLDVSDLKTTSGNEMQFSITYRTA